MLPIIPANLGWFVNKPFSRQFENAVYYEEAGFENNTQFFIQANELPKRWLALEKNTCFTIAETGFGVALNFLLTWYYWEQYAPRSARLIYISCEKHPLRKNDLKRCLTNWPQLATQAQQLLDNYPILTPGYHHLVFEQGRVTLNLMLGDVYECFEQLLICKDPQLEYSIRKRFVDAWYLDGFSSAINSSMWSENLMGVIAQLSRENTTIASSEPSQYLADRKKTFIKPETPWHYSATVLPKGKTAIIVGAGLAGCFTAFFLAQKGWKVTLLEELEAVGYGASANPQAVLFPKLSAYQTPLTELMLTAFVYASQFYKKFLQDKDLGELKGSLLLAYTDKEKKAQQSLNDWLISYPELGQLVGAKEGSDLCGLSLNQPGLFIPLSGWINSPQLCEFLINSPQISLMLKQKVEFLEFVKDHWKINNLSASVVILANGNKMNDFVQTKHLPLQSLRGQMSCIAASEASSQLKIPLCAKGHVLPSKNNRHWLGASFDLGCSNVLIKDEDDQHNLEKIPNQNHHQLWSKQLVDHWAGIRASTPDYLPLVGSVPKEQEFLERYKGFALDSKRWIPHSGPYYQGLYVCSGFGARGLTTIPLCCEWLASLINEEIGCLPRTLIKAISPARFLRKNLIATDPAEKN